MLMNSEGKVESSDARCSFGKMSARTIRLQGVRCGDVRRCVELAGVRTSCPCASILLYLNQFYHDTVY